MPLTVAVDPKKLVVATENYSIIEVGRCVACDASGWLEPAYGYPHRVKKAVMQNRLIHAKNCPMNAVLRDDGTLKYSRAPSKKRRRK